MKVYVDFVFLLNFYLDFLLLMVTSIVLKRNASIKNIILGTLIGSFSLIFLFFRISSFLLFFFKVVIAILMILVTFGYRDLKNLINNLGYFYMISVILGGFLYYLNVEFSYKQVGLIFINNGLSVNAIFLIIISPIILYIYIRQAKQFKSLLSLTYKVEITLRNKRVITLNGFLDTGNKLIDPITNKPIILIEKGIIDEDSERIYYIPFNSLNNHNLLKCIKPLYVVIDEKKYNNYLLGISDKKFHLDGVQCLLNNKLMEEM